MQRELSIVGVVLNGKENYLEWSRKIEHTLIFNDLSDDIFDGDTKSTKPTTYKELAIWMNKDKKSYALIVASVNEEVSYHIRSIKDSWSALKKLKDPYDSHSKLELIQLLMKLFNLEMKDNDPMALAYEIKAIIHDVDAIGVKIDIALATFIQAFYPTYSHYLQSLQASVLLKSLDFDSLVKKIEECEKYIVNKTIHPTRETMCIDK